MTVLYVARLGIPSPQRKELGHRPLARRARMPRRLIRRLVEDRILAFIAHVAHVLQGKISRYLGDDIFSRLDDNFPDGVGRVQHVAVGVRGDRHLKGRDGVFL